MEDKCNVCGLEAKFYCQRCSDSYCSVKCQVQDWPTHRYICLPMPKLLERPTNVQRPVEGVVSRIRKMEINRHVSEDDLETRSRTQTRSVMEIPRPPKAAPTDTKVQEVVAKKSSQFLLVTSMIANGVNSFAGKLSTVFAENMFTVVVEYPEVFSHFDDLMKDFNKDAAKSSATALETGLMIAVAGPSTFVRAVVIAFDTDANACVVYHCDLGTFDVIPISVDKIKACPAKYTDVPFKALLVELLTHVEPDREKFLKTFFKESNILSFDIKKKRNGVLNGDIKINGKEGGTVVVHESTPSLNASNIIYWTIQPPPNTPVRALSLKLETDAHAWIHHADKYGMYESILCTSGQKLERCKTIPTKGLLVVHIQGQRGSRLIVRKQLPLDMVEVSDLDNGRTYKIEWNVLKISNDFVKNLPVYGMSVQLKIIPELFDYDKELVLEFLQNMEFQKKEFVLSHRGILALGAILVVDDQPVDEMIVKSLNVKKAAQEELNRKRKEEMEQQKIKDIENRRTALLKAMEKEKAEKEKAEKEKAEKEKAEQEKAEKEKASKLASKKIFFSDMNLIPLEVGRTKHFIVTDTTESGLVGVCEGTAENASFLAEICVKCDEYVKEKIKDKLNEFIGYRPIPNEMCLARYVDGGWYRAKCISNEGSTSVLLLIDFATLFSADAKVIMPLPEEVKEPPPRTHLIRLEGDQTKTAALEVYSKHKLVVKSYDGETYVLSYA